MLDLLRRECGHGDDQIARLGRLARLSGEAGAKVGGGVIRGHHEKIVKGADRVPGADIDALIERVEEGRAGCAIQNAAAGVGRQRVVERAQDAM